MALAEAEPERLQAVPVQRVTLSPDGLCASCRLRPKRRVMAGTRHLPTVMTKALQGVRALQGFLNLPSGGGRGI